MKFVKGKYSFAIIYTIILILASVFVMYDALKLEKDAIKVEKNEFSKEEYEKVEKIVEENKYQDENISINISYDRIYDSEVYIADVKIKDIKYLKSAFAKNKFGKNVVDVTSNMAKENNAIFAINGDYYGFRTEGFVIRNGVMYRDSARKSGKDSCLLIFNDGSIDIIYERSTILQEEIDKAKLNNNEIVQAYTFGPGLVYDGEIINGEEEEDLNVHPRMAIGMLEPLHYVIVAVDGRTNESVGITIRQLAEYMLQKGCNIAYNLDGGSSATMYFNGRIINKPSSFEEREVSDIVYIGY